MNLLQNSFCIGHISFILYLRGHVVLSFDIIYPIFCASLFVSVSISLSHFLSVPLLVCLFLSRSFNLLISLIFNFGQSKKFFCFSWILFSSITRLTPRDAFFTSRTFVSIIGPFPAFDRFVSLMYLSYSLPLLHVKVTEGSVL